MKIIHNKLVRDKIPEIIAKQGKRVSFRGVKGDELKAALKDKLIEEVNELVNASTLSQIIEEVADIEEVLCAFKYEYGISHDTNDARRDKAIEKGTFSCGYFLESVTEADNE